MNGVLKGHVANPGRVTLLEVIDFALTETRLLGITAWEVVDGIIAPC